MALPPGLGGDVFDGDRKRLMQRADTFAIGTGTRESKDRDDVKGFDQELDTALKPRHAKVKTADEDIEKQVRDTEDHRKSQLLDEAKRRGSSSLPANLYPGLLTLPGIGVPPPMIGETGRSESRGRAGGVESVADAEPKKVSPEVLGRLKEAGLADPIASLDDPRLGKSGDRLSESFALSLSGTDRVHVWSQNGCHQILTIGMSETKVESAAGTTVETLKKKGNAEEKTVTYRPAPSDAFPDIEG